MINGIKNCLMESSGGCGWMVAVSEDQKSDM